MFPAPNRTGPPHCTRRPYSLDLGRRVEFLAAGGATGREAELAEGARLQAAEPLPPLALNHLPVKFSVSH